MRTFIIQADYREKPSGIPEKLLQKQAEVSLEALPAGDYIVNGQVLIERKTAEDFIQSLVSNRLFERCLNLKKYMSRCILLIEGNPYETRHAIDRQAIRGAILSILVSWQIPVMVSKNKDDSAELIMLAGKQSDKNQKVIPLVKGYKSAKIRNHRLQFLQGLPAIGPVTAHRLYRHFGSIHAVINAPVSELMKVKGVGKKIATAIRDFIING